MSLHAVQPPKMLRPADALERLNEKLESMIEARKRLEKRL